MQTDACNGNRLLADVRKAAGDASKVCMGRRSQCAFAALTGLSSATILGSHPIEEQRPNTVKQAVPQLTLATTGKRLYEFTPALTDWVRSQNIHTGLLTV